jgi:hypothetical protein
MVVVVGATVVVVDAAVVVVVVGSSMVVVGSSAVVVVVNFGGWPFAHGGGSADAVPAMTATTRPTRTKSPGTDRRTRRPPV